MAKRPSIQDFINYHKDVGPLQAIYCGYPGSGKSNHASSIVTRCLQDREGYKGEMALMHGDMACEWRHYLNFPDYVKKIFLLIPDTVKDQIEFINTDWKKYPVPLEIKYISLDNPNWTIVDVEYMQPNCITVLYDACFTDVERTVLWARIAYQLAYRIIYVDNAITYLCHEAHEIFPQTAGGDQWYAIKSFISSFSLWRKRLIRAILICHQESEIYERIRKKCYWKIFRDSFPTSRYMRKVIYDNIFNTTIATYHLFKGIMYRANNTSEEMKEIHQNWLMIPRILINLNVDTNSVDDGKIKTITIHHCGGCGYSWQSRVEEPVKCPKCYTRLSYNQTKEIEEALI